MRTPSQRVLMMHAASFPSEEPHQGTVFVFHDVSALRRLDDVRRDFIANASHELRTPLTAIQGFADTLSTAENLDDEQTRSYLDVISRNAQRMANLIDDLLALSRIEGGRMDLESTDLDIVRLANTVISDFAPRFEQSSLDARLHAGVCPPCRGDRRAVEQILGNLLSNAARYTNPGGRIDVHVRPGDDCVTITVADTGIGISEADRERVFERFYRVDAARSRALGGTGLGLAIVKHLVGAMRGQIEVESEPGKGSRFSFTLPLA
jgi:two-component system phosphate regulon sensor histidine kinase PhoR